LVTAVFLLRPVEPALAIDFIVVLFGLRLPPQPQSQQQPKQQQQQQQKQHDDDDRDEADDDERDRPSQRFETASDNGVLGRRPRRSISDIRGGGGITQ
jgi:hypothetical protein